MQLLILNVSYVIVRFVSRYLFTEIFIEILVLRLI